MPATSESMRLGVVVERREIDNPWQQYAWHAVGAMPGAPDVDGPRILHEAPGIVQYHAATLDVSLHRSETEGYKRNLANEAPVVYVVLRPDEAAGDDMPRPFLATVCPYEAQDYLDSGGLDDLVEAVPMPEAVQAWVQAYVDAHHVDEPFKKRKRKQWKREEAGFAPRPRVRARPQRH